MYRSGVTGTRQVHTYSGVTTVIGTGDRLAAAVDALSEVLANLDFRLPTADFPVRQRKLASLRRKVDIYLKRRVAQPDAPAVIAVIGSTGTGKSTLINSLAGATISPATALRPTTDTPVVWCHVSRQQEFAGWGVVVGGSSEFLESVSLVDTPDIDSLVVDHRLITEGLLDAVDGLIFVTTTQRYADAVPWEVLAGIKGRLPTQIVVNRVTRRSAGAMVDFARLLKNHEVDVAEPVVINEQHLNDGLLPATAVRPLRKSLLDISAPEHVDAALRRTFQVVEQEVFETVAEFAKELGESELLKEDSKRIYGQAAADSVRAIGQGSFVRGEVIGRWGEMVGSTTIERFLGKRWGRSAVHELRSTARAGLVAELERRVRRAAALTASAWEGRSGGAAMLEAHPDLRRGGAFDITALIDGWLGEMGVLVAKEAGGKIRLARIASTGINLAALALLVAVFTHTGGLTGGEVGVAAGAAALQQQLLEKVLGRVAATRLITQSRKKLMEAAATLFEEDRRRFDAVLPPSLSTDQLEAARSDLARVVGEHFD